MKKYNFFLINIKYIYEITSNSTLKEQLFLVNIVVYILIKGFKFHIEKILYYLFKLKYLNQNFFYSKLKIHNFFFVIIEYIYVRASNPTLKK